MQAAITTNSPCLVSGEGTLSGSSTTVRPMADSTMSHLVEDAGALSATCGLISQCSHVSTLHIYSYIDLWWKTCIYYIADVHNFQTDYRLDANIYKFQLLLFAKKDKMTIELIEQSKGVQIDSNTVKGAKLIHTPLISVP